ncbi:hypothetical protein D9615_001515 [Tricholomella constricta]|uniref:Inner centromere protein ARK-binding domain-containing protein n=1 Tax=Tricholomella constricta TaxID=117010 RepID=A0A8H5HLB8_9AGAR|nr:hypothetical protein D9615_001515 [Tricholomella constricta]
MAGLLEWSNSLRFKMANDPGRELFQDQLNTHGFIFLNDYLDNILSGPSQDPLIELVKTPGRKKVASKKINNLGASKLNHIMSLEDDEHEEILTTSNSFHKALLKVKDQTVANATNPPQFQPSLGDELFSPASPPPKVVTEYSPAALKPPNPGSTIPSRSEQNDLSVIAEDDESSESNPLARQRSYSEAQPPSSPRSQSDVDKASRQVPSFVPVALTGHLSPAVNVTDASSDTFHSITLDSPRQTAHQNVQSPSVPPISLESSDPKPTARLENYTAPLPEIPPWNAPGTHDEAMTAPLPAATSTFGQDIHVPLRDQNHAPSSPKGGETKFGVALFPALPAPMPLRKSMRAPRDPSMGTGSLGAATPGAPVGGKRTSWLKKAREVKALEVISKRPSTLVPPVPLTSNSLKRKSGDMLLTTCLEDEERRPKSAKSHDDDVAPLKAVVELQRQPSTPLSPVEHAPVGQEGMLDRFKRTVEGLGARVGKSMGKSLGAGAAVSALAEARAAAEARVAERHYKEDEMTRVMAPVSTLPPANVAPSAAAPVVPAELESAGRRLSVTDLFPPNDGSVKMKSKAGKSFQFTPPPSEIATEHRNKANRESTTTTPPDSPPATRPINFILPSGPVFNKPPPVFVAPVPASKPLLKDFAIHLPPPAIFSIHAPMSLGISPRPPSPSFSTQKDSLSKQSALESMKSDAMFDDTDVPAWVPNTQDTEYLSAFGSQSQSPSQNALDEDDSWPIDEKLAPGVQWTFGGGNVKEDSMTWSTLPSQSQRADTGTSHKDQPVAHSDEPYPTNRAILGAFAMDVDEHHDNGQEEDADISQDDSELEDVVMHGKSTVSRLETKATRSESKMSMASSQSSQSHAGLLGQASKLLSSALGTSKKGKPEVKKVLQMAAVAAKKQQEESDKKAARLKEMENRRQLAIQRKAEEEKARSLEQERKLKEEGERRKREREEHTDKRPLKVTVKKDDDIVKKRKVTVAEFEKKELKKAPSKPALKSSMKQPTALSSSAAYNASLQSNASSAPSKLVDPKPPKPAIPSLKEKGKAVPPKQPTVPQDDLSQPSQLMQIQMATRAKAQLQAAAFASEPPIASESIELPDIDSEYSDSDDEDRPKSFPEWAQSPELREALQLQSTINPDDIFGAIRPLRMEELFKTRTSRFRARTSSANWTGADRLTLEEEREYAKRMGFK